jgi:hypothetical protein
MKKILLAALLALPIITNANPNNPRYWINSLNKTEAAVQVKIDKPWESTFIMEGMGGITFHVDGRSHNYPTFPFTMKYKKSTGHIDDEYTVVIGKEYEYLRCVDYEFTIEVHEYEHPAITYAGCKTL